MNEGMWVGLIGVFAFLILAVSEYRSHNIGSRKTVTMVMIWLGIFLIVVLAFSWLG